MADVPQPPSPGKNLLGESEPLKAYHALMGPFFDQIRDAFGALPLAVVTDAITLTAGTDGALSNVFVAASFLPLVVCFRAEQLDSAQRPTGSFVGGVACWSSRSRSGEQGVQVTKAPGLTSGTSYAVTFVARSG